MLAPIRNLLWTRVGWSYQDAVDNDIARRGAASISAGGNRPQEGNFCPPAHEAPISLVEVVESVLGGESAWRCGCHECSITCRGVGW